MLDRLRRTFASPIFADEEKTRASRFVINFSWVAIGVVLVLILSRLFFWTDDSVVPVFVLAAIIPILLFVRYVVKLGHVNIANVVLVLTMWGILTFLGFHADGIRDAAVIAYIVVIVGSSLVLGWRFAAVMGGLSIVVVWIFAVMEKQGLRTLKVDDPISFARDISGIIILVCFLIYLLISNWSQTLESAKLELKERLHAEEKLQRQADYLAALNKTALGLLSRFELQPLLEVILTRACDLIGTQHGSIELVLPDGSALQQAVGYGALAKFNRSLTLKNEGVTGEVWNSGQPLVIQDYGNWDKSVKKFVDAGFCAVMGQPLRVEDKVIGVLAVAYLGQNQTFTQEQVNLMGQFASLASLAIDNARLHEKAQKEILDRSLIEVELRASEARMRAILTSIPDMIFEISRDGTFLDFMASSEIKPVTSASHFIGKNIKHIFPPAIAEQTFFALDRALATGQIHAFEYGMPPGEEVQFFEARVVAITSGSAIMMVRDISQQKYVQTERENLINELEGKNSELERFTYTVSHDLKSPLITIKGFLGFLEQDAVSGNITRLKADIQRISNATEKMQTLLNELLELSRIGRLANPYQSFAFEELAHEAVELVQGQIQSRGIYVFVHENLPAVYGDRQRLLEAIQNLVDNAAKFMGDQPHPRIEIGLHGYEDDKPIFYVMDNGMGIDLVHHDRIFGLFNKLDANTEGTGIGLALVKRIIEVHGGRIWVQSEAEKGSTFFFTLQPEPAN